MRSTMTRWDPFRDAASVSDEMEQLFRQALGSRAAATAGAWAPVLDVEEHEDGFVLHVELPGVHADDVEVSLEESVLTISGERRFYREDDTERFRRVERHFGRFHRAVRLPDRVDPDGVDAEFRDGMLTISVPKAEEAKPRRISVRTS